MAAGATAACHRRCPTASASARHTHAPRCQTLQRRPLCSRLHATAPPPDAAPAVAGPAGSLEAVALAFTAWYKERARDMPADLKPRALAGPHG
jgi:hypothetical protein